MEGPIRTVIVSALGVVFIAAGLILLRQKGSELPTRVGDAHAGESEPGTISLEKLRALGY